jgi:hypothetical protein
MRNESVRWSRQELFMFLERGVKGGRVSLFGYVWVWGVRLTGLDTWIPFCSSDSSLLLSHTLSCLLGSRNPHKRPHNRRLMNH